MRSIVLLVLLCSCATPSITVTDGDTIKVGAESIRVMGIDTPEPLKQHAGCPEEIEKGRAASAALQALLKDADVTLERAKGKDKWGRSLARVFVDGTDVSELMIASGHAAEYHGKGPRPDWCN